MVEGFQDIRDFLPQHQTVGEFMQTVTKYCYIFEAEHPTQAHIEAVFGGMNDLHDSAEKALSELNWERTSNASWLNRMEETMGSAQIMAVDFVDGRVVRSRKV